MIEVMEMQIDDLEQVMPIEEENFSKPWSETGYFTYLIRSDAMFLAAKDGDELVGYCGVLLIVDEGEITNVSVKKDRQGQGIGRLLMEELIRKTQREGIHILHLEVRKSNQAALALYEHLGFTQDGLRKNYYEDPVEDAVLMTRK